MRRVECEMWSVEGLGRADSSRSWSAFRLPPSALRTRSAFTLVELLIVILIISILAALVLGVATIAGETARKSQSRHMVERLHTLLMEHYDSYKARRVKLNPKVEQAIQNKISNTANRGQATAEARLYALREMMLMEAPDRWSDVILERVEDFNPTAPAIKPLYLADRTDLANVYFRRFASLIGRKNTVTGTTNTAEDIKANQSAECLYMIVTLACGDGEARSLFAEKNIGDTDGDGAPEFLDGWGHPISFLRWAPGFDSQIETNANQFSGPSDAAWTDAATKDHDPFDVFRAEPAAFRLVPLIYSSGRDETAGIEDFPDHVVWPSISSLGAGVNTSAPYLYPRLTPYEKPSSVNPGRTDYMGTAAAEGATDNVHNHLVGLR